MCVINLNLAASSQTLVVVRLFCIGRSVKMHNYCTTRYFVYNTNVPVLTHLTPEYRHITLNSPLDRTHTLFSPQRPIGLLSHEFILGVSDSFVHQIAGQTFSPDSGSDMRFDWPLILGKSESILTYLPRLKSKISLSTRYSMLCHNVPCFYVRLELYEKVLIVNNDGC